MEPPALLSAVQQFKYFMRRIRRYVAWSRRKFLHRLRADSREWWAKLVHRTSVLRAYKKKEDKKASPGGSVGERSNFEFHEWIFEFEKGGMRMLNSFTIPVRCGCFFL